MPGLLAGDLSLVEAGEGWPMEDSLVSMRTAEKYDVELPGWFVTLDGLVIGDIATHGDVGEDGDIEIGYNLAEPSRRAARPGRQHSVSPHPRARRFRPRAGGRAVHVVRAVES